MLRFHTKKQPNLNLLRLGLLVGLSIIGSLMMPAHPAQAANLGARVQANAAIADATTVSTTLTSVTAGNLVVVVCANKLNSTMSVTTPTGFTTAITQSGAPSQAIFYNIAIAGQNSYTCSFSASGPVAIQVFEYRGIVTPITNVQTSSAVGSSAAYSIGSVTTTIPNRVNIGAYIVNTGTTAPGWTNGFIGIQDQGVPNGNPNGRYGIGSTELITTTTGTYGSVGNGTGNSDWRGQMISFSAEPRELTVSIVNATGVPVASPSLAMSPITTAYQCQSSTGTLGSTAQRLRVKNTTVTPAWSMSIAATGGATATWNSGGNSYAYNNAGGAGCTAGQFTINPSVATVTPRSGCTNTGLTLGSSQAFNNPTVNTVTLLSASSAANIECFWDVTGIALSQQIPAERVAGTYTLNLTATVVAI